MSSLFLITGAPQCLLINSIDTPHPHFDVPVYTVPPLGTCQFQARAALFLTHGAGRAPSKENRPGQPKNSVCERLCAWLCSGLFGGKGPANQQV